MRDLAPCFFDLELLEALVLADVGRTATDLADEAFVEEAFAGRRLLPDATFFTF
jgi:hypothetical protein